MHLPGVDELLDTLGRALRAHLERRAIARPFLVGIRTGGVWVAERLRAPLGVEEALGTLDISFHRDDFDRGLHPTVRPSELPLDLEGRDIVLVDDVLYTGRTIRAAINEIFDWGRPASVSLAVLVARDGRELPVQADAAGAVLDVGPGRELKLRGPSPLRLELVDRAP